MSAAVDILNPRCVAIVASNPAISEQTGWPIGFWWSEMVHPYWELVENGYEVEIFCPDGGRLEGDKWSDPRDESKYSAEDILSLGSISSPEHMKLVENSKPMANLKSTTSTLSYSSAARDRNEGVPKLAAQFYEAGKILAVICHATCILLKTRLSNGNLLVEGKTWTGFANSEEQYADSYVGRHIQPFRVEDEARKLPNTNFIVNSRFRPYAVRDGRLVTGQQQYSGTAAVRLVIQALGM